METIPPPQKGGRAPKFLAHGYCGQTALWIKMALGMEVGLGPVHIVLDGDTAPPRKGDRAQKNKIPPNFIVAKLLDASRCHLVWRWASAQATLCQMGNSPYPKRGGAPPNFGPCLLWPNGWMDEDATW